MAQLGGQIAAEIKLVAARSAAAASAEQQYAEQLTVEQQARAAATTASRRVDSAAKAYHDAQQAVGTAALIAYESDGGPDSQDIGTLGTLLIADNPSAVLATDTQRRLLVDHQMSVVDQARLALNTLRAAQRGRGVALADVTRETERLAAIRAVAETALADTHRTVAALTAGLAEAKVSQHVADTALSVFLGGWSAADPKRATALNMSYAKVELENKQVAAAPAGSEWTAAMGRTVVERALRYIGTKYAWAGGNAEGPTRGECTPGDAHLDCTYVGFDCSGLALYAWSPYLAMAHYAATQYSSGSVHPSPAQLLPGDLVFWSSTGTAAGIHHVAIYVGGGNVIQAPQSGDIVRITPLRSVAAGYFGATRPLT